MKNPHIVVGEFRRCLCGMYGDRSTSCADVLAALERQEQTGSPDARLLAEVIKPLITECDDTPQLLTAPDEALTAADEEWLNAPMGTPKSPG